MFLSCGWAYEGEVIVSELDLGIVGIDFVDVERNRFVIFVSFNGIAWDMSYQSLIGPSC